MEPLFYSDFYNCFEKSISPLKWDANKLWNYMTFWWCKAKRTLFIDDKKENTDAAFIRPWNLQGRRRGGLIQ
jgi:putative hydrolase of the HAD superfamily